MDIQFIDSTPSTNSLIATMPDAPHGTVVATRHQTAGRGQRGNSWESEPDANITLSMLLRPEGLSPRNQFVISQIVALAIVDTITPLLTSADGYVTIKWPNDIYVGDKKIAGILIENTLSGNIIERSIVGIGLNVNQKEFHSDAPNPISLAQITGSNYDIAQLTTTLVENILKAYDYYIPEYQHHNLQQLYFDSLWRGHGTHAYIDTATGRIFEASIVDVAPTGHITLEDTDGNQLTYAFKEVAAI